MKLIDRLFQYFDLKGIKPTSFEKEIGLANGYLGKQRDRKASIGSDILEKIVYSCPDLNVTWLVTGEGKMVTENLKSTNSTGIEHTQLNTQLNTQAIGVNEPKSIYKQPQVPIILTLTAEGNSLIPFVNIKSRAGYLAGYGDPEYIQELPHYSLPGFTSGHYMAFQIDGWSMFKEEIGEGLRKDDWIICQHVESLENIKDNRVYTIVSKEEGIITKRLLNRLKNDDPKIIAMSDNKSGGYEHIIVRPDQIAQVWEFKLHFNRFLTSPADMYDKISEIQGDYIIIKDTLKDFKQQLDEMKRRLEP